MARDLRAGAPKVDPAFTAEVERRRAEYETAVKFNAPPPVRVANTPGGGNVGVFNAANPVPLPPTGGYTPAPKIVTLVSDINAGGNFIESQLKDAADDPEVEPAGFTPPPSIFAKIWAWLITHPTDTADLNKFIWGGLLSFVLGLLWKLGRNGK